MKSKETPPKTPKDSHSDSPIGSIRGSPINSPNPLIITRNLIAIFVVLASWCTSFANITIIGVTNASNVTGLTALTSGGTASASATPSTTQGQVNVYGGIAGPSSSCKEGTGGNSLCDNCATGTDGLVDCNYARINPGLLVTISFVSSTATGLPGASYSDGTNVIPIQLRNVATTQVPKGTQTFASLYWSDICPFLYVADKSSNATGCVTNAPASGIIRIGILTGGDSTLGQGASNEFAPVSFTISGALGDGTATSVRRVVNGRTGNFAYPCSAADSIITPTGVCGFSMLPGDAKAFIGDVQANPGFPSNTGLKFSGARLYYSTTSFDDIKSSSLHSELLPSATDANSAGGPASFSPAEADGLENEKLYYFKVASVDLAGNVSFFTDAGAAGDTYCTGSTAPINPQGADCHKALPGAVYGALGETKNCFVATAAYGSPMAPQVDTFRQFRNRFLLNHTWGKSFVRFYYEHSPKYANIIAQNETLRFFARLALWPILAFVSLALHFGLINALILILAALALPTAFYVLRQKRGVRA